MLLRPLVITTLDYRKPIEVYDEVLVESCGAMTA
jgi:hypothetical protein